jgi:hypothetical protein
MRYFDRYAARAENYPTAEKMFVGSETDRTINVVAPQKNLVKPYFLSHYDYRANTVICSGNIMLIDAATNPFAGIMINDTYCGKGTYARIQGTTFMPVHESVTIGQRASRTAWKGKTAYLVCEGENWGVTDDLGGSTGIAIGRFLSGIDFRPNNIGWGDRFAKVYLDPSMAGQNSPVVITENTTSCCFGGCVATAYPEVILAKGKSITVNTNAFALNPGFQIESIQWAWDGTTEDVLDNDGNVVTQPKTNFEGVEQEHTIHFDDYGTYTLTLRIRLSKIDSESECGCGESVCCIIKELSIVVTANSAIFCDPNPAPAPVATTYQIVHVYVDADVSDLDNATHLVLGSGAVSLGSAINFASASSLQSAIEGVLDTATIAYGSVSVNYTVGAADGDTSTLVITITDVVSPETLEGITAVKNSGSPAQIDFVVI